MPIHGTAYQTSDASCIQVELCVDASGSAEEKSSVHAASVCMQQYYVQCKGLRGAAGGAMLKSAEHPVGFKIQAQWDFYTSPRGGRCRAVGTYGSLLWKYEHGSMSNSFLGTAWLNCVAKTTFLGPWHLGRGFGVNTSFHQHDHMSTCFCQEPDSVSMSKYIPVPKAAPERAIILWKIHDSADAACRSIKTAVKRNRKTLVVCLPGQ